MADTPTPTPGSTPENKEAQEAFIKMFARLGFKIDPLTDQEVSKAMSPIQRFMKDFSKTADVKNTFFGKLPGIKQQLQALLPDQARFNMALIKAGQASLDGADGMAFYNNSLGFLGKGLVQVTRLFHVTGESSMALARTMMAAEVLATVGISLLIAAAVGLAQSIWNVVLVGVQWQERLNKFNRTLGGVTRDRLMMFNDQINQQIVSMGKYGFSLSEVLGGMQSYIASGLNMAKVMKEDLIQNTLLLSEVSGQSASELSGFFSGIMRGSKVSGDNIKALGNTWTAFNKSVEASGVLGVVSFNEVQEAITSVGTALLIASNKGKTFTDTLTSDLVSLTGLAKALNISISDLNAKFEQAGNLITGQESGFRALLAISGGANIENMLNNQFNRTDAMIKVADRLAMLNTQFGGNLNILGQVAESTFGVSKDVAIKLATMTAEQRRALIQAQQDSKRLQDDSLKKSWESITGTFSAQFDRLKNVLASAIQRAFAGNSSVQNFLDKVTNTLSRWVNEIGNPNSGIGKFVSRLGDIIGTVFDKFSIWFDNLVPILEEVKETLEQFFTNISGQGGFFHTLGTMIYEVLKVPVVLLGKLFAATLEMSFGNWIGTILGGIIGTALAPGLGTVIGGMLGSAIGKSVGIDPQLKQIIDNTDPTNPKLEESHSRLSNKISEALKQNQEEQNRLNGLKDTDIVIGKNGEFTLAGLERLDLQDEQAKLQQEQTDATKENTQAVKDLTNMMNLQRNTSGVVNDTLAERYVLKPPVAAPGQRSLYAAAQNNLGQAPDLSAFGLLML